VLKSGGKLNPKYPGGIEQHKVLLEKEGFKVLKKGKNMVVENYQKYLYKNLNKYIKIPKTK